MSNCQRGLIGNKVVPLLKAAIEDFKILLPIILDLRNPALLTRHWNEIQTIIGCTLDDQRT